MVLNGMDMVWCLGKVKEGKNWKKLENIITLIAHWGEKCLAHSSLYDTGSLKRYRPIHVAPGHRIDHRIPGPDNPSCRANQQH